MIEERIKEINKWIDSNPQVTEPNFYEIIDCTIGVGVERRGQEELAKMYRKRKIFTEECSFIEENEQHKAFLQRLFDDCVTGRYVPYQDEQAERKRRELICKVFSVPFWLYGMAKENPSYRYDNVSEYSDMLYMYSKIKPDDEYKDFLSSVLRSLKPVGLQNSQEVDEMLDQKASEPFVR